MNQFKEDLHQELQSMSLSEEKKQRIATKAKARVHNQKGRIHLQYRFVLATFTIFVLGFSYLLWQKGDFASKSQSAATLEPVSTSIWSILNNDFLKTILFISFFIILRTLVKRKLQKGGKGLPVCVKCSEEWSYRESLKQSMKNGKMTCPRCGHKQFRTKKSLFRGGMLNMMMPFIVIIPHLFDNILLGIVVYASGAAYVILSLSPYYLELQEKDSVIEPLW